MTYTCKSPHPRLTVGKQHTEIMPNPNPYNAFIWNDDGEHEHFLKAEFFTGQTTSTNKVR